MPVHASEFTVGGTGHVALYYPKELFTAEEVRAIYRVETQHKRRAHPVLRRYRVVQVGR